MEWLTGFLTTLLRPILTEIIQDLMGDVIQWAQVQHQRLKAYEAIDQESQELIERMANATTSEERWAHLRNLRRLRADRLRSSS